MFINYDRIVMTEIYELDYTHGVLESTLSDRIYQSQIYELDYTHGALESTLSDRVDQSVKEMIVIGFLLVLWCPPYKKRTHII